eukprot:snap_masked-scaffold124_size330879-processed-gene-1.10 protein:Tk01487 transcript:snap_masked-scaffold124_size330879-processed-gene-1.10-mRNA-1 annotation:"long-chain-fatty-acid-- ligase acsbg2"
MQPCGPLRGPDQLLPTPSQRWWTCQPEGSVALRDRESMSAVPPLSVPTLLRQAARDAPDQLALAVKREGHWVHWSYAQYYADSRTAAKGFVALGLEPFHSVGILGFNAPEWFIAQNAAIMAHGFSAGIYTTNSPEACLHIALDCRANILVVEDEKQLDKILQIRPQLPDLKCVVQYLGTPHKEGVISWARLMELGAQESDDELERRLSAIAINQCCSLIYTSGTTGSPKGVMMSHDNFTWTARIANSFLKVTTEDSFISYLPLSHSAAQMIDVWMPMAARASVYFADRNALKGSLVNTLKEVRPTFFFGVPRIYEKIQEKMVQIGKSSGAVKRLVADWAKRTGLQHNLRALEGQITPNQPGYSYPLAKKLVFSKVQENLGLDKCRIMGVGAAPMARETFEYFLSLDIPLLECYGMSETSGPQTGNRPGQHRLGSIGPSLDGCKTKIFEADPDGHGEVLMRGRNIMMGYLFNEEKTREAIDDEGWLHSGDIGKELAESYFKITGRIKELIITAGGENVPPVLIEDVLKKELPCLSNTMVIGDRKKFLSCLLTLKVEVDVDTLEPKPELAAGALDWCKEIGSKAKTIDEAANDELVRKALQEGVDRTNQQATSNAQRIQKWHLLNHDFSVPGGELGPTLKLKRHFVEKKYETQIRNFYNS